MEIFLSAMKETRLKEHRKTTKVRASTYFTTMFYFNIIYNDVVMAISQDGRILNRYP